MTELKVATSIREVLDSYFEMWNETDPVRRQQIIYELRREVRHVRSASGQVVRAIERCLYGHLDGWHASAMRKWLATPATRPYSSRDPQGDRGYRRQTGLVRAVHSSPRGFVVQGFRSH